MKLQTGARISGRCRLRKLLGHGPAVLGILLSLTVTMVGQSASSKKALPPEFQTSDRCIACHNGLLTSSGEDVSIGIDWRTSMMANSARDPYWQAGVRRESVDHPEAQTDIEDECSVCHMPMARYEANFHGRKGQVFSHLPFPAEDMQGRQAEDGVSCSVCHQIGKQGLGTPDSFNGGFVVDAPEAGGNRPEYGPFQIDTGHAQIMQSSTEGFHPTQDEHILQSELCATCHTLLTTALGPGGKPIGSLPEQVPYQEWLHSDFRNKQSCQSCHMPVVPEEIPIASVLGEPRHGLSRHVFVGGNFFMLRMLNRYRNELHVTAPSKELTAAADRTVQYLESEAARVRIENVSAQAGRLDADVVVENLGGHKLPTAYPSRRAWLHFIVRDANHNVVFESGALNPDGSIQGNDNDADAARFEPHYTEIHSSEQVQIYESIMADQAGVPTTGLLTAVRYLKDNRLLPQGFDKQTADPDIIPHGGAVEDPNFAGGSDRVEYSVDLANNQGPFSVEAELWYQPIGFRWANNLKRYEAFEPQRFSGYYDSMGPLTAVRLARAARETILAKSNALSHSPGVRLP
jgi:hypothetical protein